MLIKRVYTLSHAMFLTMPTFLGDSKPLCFTNGTKLYYMLERHAFLVVASLVFLGCQLCTFHCYGTGVLQISKLGYIWTYLTLE